MTKAMVKENAQDIINTICVDEYLRIGRMFPLSHKKLFNCSAEILFYTDGTIALRSYNTVIATYEDSVVCDFLRHAYGYTATSNQHFHKFLRWLDNNGYNVSLVHRYR